MAHVQFAFKAGTIEVHHLSKKRNRASLRLLGNGWRGILVLSTAMMWIYGLWELGAILLGFALIWSVIETALKRSKEMVVRQQVLRALREGDTELALMLCGKPEPNTALWWRLLGLHLKQGRWKEAETWLEELEAGEEKKYLLAIIKLGQLRGKEALALCPARVDGKWRIVKAEALFIEQQWQQVLNLLRGRSTKERGWERIEHAWLKGGSYFFLGQYKPAIRLLKQVVDQTGDDYGPALDWLQRAMAKLN